MFETILLSEEVSLLFLLLLKRCASATPHLMSSEFARTGTAEVIPELYKAIQTLLAVVFLAEVGDIFLKVKAAVPLPPRPRT